MSSVPEYAVIAKLRASTGLTALVGGNINPLHNAQSSGTPRIVVLRPPGQNNAMLSTGLVGISRTPITVVCVGKSYDESRSLTPLVITALSGGTWTGSQFWNGTEIGSCMFDDEFDHSVFPQIAEEIGFPVEFVTFNLEHSST